MARSVYHRPCCTVAPQYPTFDADGFNQSVQALYISKSRDAEAKVQALEAQAAQPAPFTVSLPREPGTPLTMSAHRLAAFVSDDALRALLWPPAAASVPAPAAVAELSGRTTVPAAKRTKRAKQLEASAHPGSEGTTHQETTRDALRQCRLDVMADWMEGRATATLTEHDVVQAVIALHCCGAYELLQLVPTYIKPWFLEQEGWARPVKLCTVTPALVIELSPDRSAWPALQGFVQLYFDKLFSSEHGVATEWNSTYGPYTLMWHGHACEDKHGATAIEFWAEWMHTFRPGGQWLGLLRAVASCTGECGEQGSSQGAVFWLAAQAIAAPKHLTHGGESTQGLYVLSQAQERQCVDHSCSLLASVQAALMQPGIWLLANLQRSLPGAPSCAGIPSPMRPAITVAQQGEWQQSGSRCATLALLSVQRGASCPHTGVCLTLARCEDSKLAVNARMRADSAGTSLRARARVGVVRANAATLDAWLPAVQLWARSMASVVRAEALWQSSFRGEVVFGAAGADLVVAIKDEPLALYAAPGCADAGRNAAQRDWVGAHGVASSDPSYLVFLLTEVV